MAKKKTEADEGPMMDADLAYKRLLSTPDDVHKLLAVVAMKGYVKTKRDLQIRGGDLERLDESLRVCCAFMTSLISDVKRAGKAGSP